jgi:hypothetical protein
MDLGEWDPAHSEFVIEGDDPVVSSPDRRLDRGDTADTIIGAEWLYAPAPATLRDHDLGLGGIVDEPGQEAGLEEWHIAGDGEDTGSALIASPEERAMDPAERAEAGDRIGPDR